MVKMFKLALGMLGEIVLKTAQSFVSKVVEHTADKALNDANMIKDFEVILKALHKNMKSLSDKAHDIEEAINNAELSGRKKRKREVNEWLGEVKSFEEEVNELASEVESEGFLKRLMEGGKAGNLNQEIVKLIEQSRNFGELVLDVRGIKGEPFLTDGMVGKAFSKNCETILKLLEAKEVSRIGVYGMGGVGKTTLAKQIHNQLLQQYQGDVYWVTVSQDFTIKKLQDMIARFLDVDLSDEEDEDRRAAILHKALSQKENSVLILDDVWDMIDLSKLGCPLTMERCRLIVTTRSLEVCRRIGCQTKIQMVKLCEDEAWKLFNDKLGEIDYGVEEIAKVVANLCGGLPLAIVTVAGAMRGETNIYAWKYALEELRKRVAVHDGEEGDEVFKVLKYSFDRLNMNRGTESDKLNRFQVCFMYCSLYPEDYAIRGDDLVRQFISNGILDQRKRRRAQIEEGHSVLNKLVNVCLLESCVDFGGQECVKMHDLVRGMALKIGEEKYMVRAGKYLKEIPYQEEWTNDLEKVSLMNNDIHRIEDGTSPDCPKLSTLLLQKNPLEVIPDSFFTRLNGLRTLDLCWNWNVNIKKLPDSISDITSLEALLLEGCRNLEYVPYLGKLKALRELNLWETGIEEVPPGVEELINLKFLAMCGRKLKILPRGLLLKLGHLQVLKLSIDTVESIEGIENLRELEEYWGGLKNVNDFNCFIGSQSRDHDAPYRIRVGPSEGHFEFPESCEKELVFYGYNLKDEKVLGRDITLLVIEKCEGLSSCFVDDLNQLGNPTSLKKVRIESCGGIECILSSEQRGSLPCDISNTLEILELFKLENMKGVMIQKEEIGAASTAPAQSLFHSLRQLKIERCNKMRTVGLSALGVPNLEEIEIESCEEIEEIIEDEGRGSVSLPKLKRLSLSHLPRLRKVGLAAWGVPELNWLSLSHLPRLRKVGLAAVGVPNLEEIHIWHCHEMEEIFEDEGRGSVSLPRLQWLSLSQLPRLRKVGLAAWVVPNLEKIEIGSCEEIEEIFEDEGRGSVSLPKLETLTLIKLPRLRKVGLAAWVVPNLEKIEIGSCEEIEEIFEDEGRGSVSLPKLKRLSLSLLPRLRKVGLAAWGVPNLEEILIWSCSEIEEIFEDEGRGSVSLPKLKRLSLKELPRLRKVGLAAWGVPNLEEILISSCSEIEEIFEDEGRGSVSLPKLKMLSLFHLPRLRKVGLAAWGVPNLQGILIWSCSEIEEIFEDEGSGSICLPYLWMLGLQDLPRLKSVCKAALICNSINCIWIEKCEILMKKLPVHLDVPPPDTLEIIEVEQEWWESLEWDNPNLPSLLQPFLQFCEE